MWTANPNNAELYAMRVLLLNTPGPTSYNDLKKVKKVECETFVEAAQKRNLLKSDDQWIRIMDDACCEKMNNNQLIRHFAQLLYHFPPTNPDQMLNHFLNQLIPQRPDGVKEEISIIHRKKILLRKIEYFLRNMGTNCT